MEGGCQEVRIHLVKSFQHFAELFRSDGQHERDTDCGRQGIAAPNPIPEFESICCVDAILRNLCGIGGNGNKVFGHYTAFHAKNVPQPLPSCICVCDSLGCGKGLGTDNKQSLSRVELARSFDKTT